MMSPPLESSAEERVPCTFNSSVIDRADHMEDPPVSTVNVNALSPAPPSTSLPESHARSTMMSVQSTTETKFSE